MLTRLRLENFRGFEDHTLPLRSMSVLVGQNNAGKSTIVEALRLVSIIANRYPNLNFVQGPMWLDRNVRYRGVSPKLDDMEFGFDNGVFHRYNVDAPAKITATFNTGAAIHVYIGPNCAVHAVIIHTGGVVIPTKALARHYPLPTVEILPQIGPLLRTESILVTEYVRRAVGSRLTSLHFRNQLQVLNEFFPQFKELAENSWPGLEVGTPETRGVYPNGERFLDIRDGDFWAEVGRMGHGLQMWLQLIWFLSRASKEGTVILDEPDVYLHADMQRKLIRLVRGCYHQVILTTHSVEIMCEIRPDEMLIIDRHRHRSKFASSFPTMQKVINHIGSAQNPQLARLWGAHKCLLVEGKDLSLLKGFQNTLFPQSKQPFDALPNYSIGGWSGWPYAIGSSMLAKNALGEDIVTYCILDSDYHTEGEIATRLDGARRCQVQLHIWKRKEIENYLLVASAIWRVIKAGMRTTVGPSVDDVHSEMLRIADDEKENLVGLIGNELFLEKKEDGFVKAMQRARNQVRQAWATPDGPFCVVSGKLVLSRLSDWSKRQFGVSFSPLAVTSAFRRSEILDEVAAVLDSIENGIPLMSLGRNDAGT